MKESSRYPERKYVQWVGKDMGPGLRLPTPLLPASLLTWASYFTSVSHFLICKMEVIRNRIFMKIKRITQELSSQSGRVKAL